MLSDTLFPPSFAYWLGVAQSDGHLWSGFVNKKRKRPSKATHLVLEVGAPSTQMIIAFKKTSGELFGAKAEIKSRTKLVHGRPFEVKMFILGLTRQMPSLAGVVFNEINPPLAFASPSLFGAYLAGVIDGDGNVRIADKRPKYGFHCEIRITSHNEPPALKAQIERLGCRASCKKLNQANAFVLTFYINSKNKAFIETHVLPFIAIERKKLVIANALAVLNSGELIKK